MREAARRVGLSELAFEIHEPEGVKDWNDQLGRETKVLRFLYCPDVVWIA